MRNAYKILVKKKTSGNFDREKNVIEYKTRVLILSATFLILRRIEQYDQNVYYIGLRAKYTYTFQVSLKLNFFYRFSKIFISNFMKIHPVGAQLFHAEVRSDRQTDMTMLRSNRRSSPFYEHV